MPWNPRQLEVDALPGRHERPAAVAASVRVERGGSVRAMLRSETAAVHAELDRKLHFLLEPTLSLERYRRVLAAFYGLYRPLERRLRDLNEVAPDLELDTEQRAPLLVRDLRALGVAEDSVTLASAAALPALCSVDHLAGCLYVLQGASIGGLVIARAVGRSLGLNAHHGAAFFAGRGSDTADRFKRVLAWLEELVAHGALGAEIAGGALGTFRAFCEWLRVRGVTT